jgi:hypothetical protein
VFTFSINPEWDEDAFEKMFNDCYPSISLMFSSLDEGQLKKLAKKQLTCLDTLVVGYYNDEPIMMTSGVTTGNSIYFVCLLFANIDGSRSYLYGEDYLTAGFQFLADNYDSYQHNEPNGTTICSYMDIVESTRDILYGTSVTETITDENGVSFTKRTVTKH